MSTVRNRGRLRGMALALVMTLLTGVTAMALAVSPTPGYAVGQHSGLIGGAADPFYVYVKAGEWITATGTANPSSSGGNGLQRVVDPAGNTIQVSDQNFTQQATQDGVWQVHYDTKYPHGTWDIEVSTAENGGGTERTGRVWAETYRMTDSQAGGANDHEFWAIDDSGYRYKIDLYDYIGINSSISANALGITQGEDCTPVYRSVQTNPQGDLWDGMQLDCGSPFRIFFEEPSADLPSSAQINGEERWIAPDELLIEELTSGTIDFAPGTDADAPGAGVFTTTVDPRFQGGYFIEIDADGDGEFNGPNDRRIPVAANGGGAYNYAFDGLDNEGTPFPACTPMNARMTFESVGEIHLVQFDVEGRSGIGLQKLNGLHAGTGQDSVIYWDDTQLRLPSTGGNPINGINPPSALDGTSGAASGPGVHGWDFNNDSWGNNRYIDDWAYTPLQQAHSEVVNFTSYCAEPAIEVEKTSDFSSDARPGDTVTYEVTATNTGDGDYTEDNPAVIFDDVSAVLDDADFDIDTVTVSHDGDLGYEEPLLSWSGALAAGDTVTMTYEVTLKGGGDGRMHNVAWQPEDPEDREKPECAEDDPACDEVENFLPKLSIDKAASDDAFTGPGDTTRYTVTVTNEGPGDYTADAPATATDDLSDVLASAELVGEPAADLGDVSFDDDTSMLSWSGVLAAGESATITYEVEYTATYDNQQDTLLENTACVPEDEVVQGAEACASVETPGPLVSQWKTVESDDDPVVAGSVVTYTLHFENTGQAPAEIDAVDHLDFVLDDAELNIDSISANVLTATFDETKLLITGTLSEGESATVTYTVTPNVDGQRTDSQLTNFLTPDGEEPPGDGVCVPTNEERPDCTTTPVEASMLLEKRGQGPTGELPLAGAQFTLTPGGGEPIDITDETTAGIFLVEGLAPGDYTLTETRAPEGYNLLADPITFEVLASGGLSVDASDTVRIEDDGQGTWRLIVVDTTAFDLPLTGGTGTLMWTIGGLLLAGSGLAISLVRVRRK